MPPRSLKSICASVALPAWLLGHDPTRRIICASYAQELSVKLANDFRLVVTSDWYRRLFPHTRLDPQKNTETEVVTTARGYRLATSVGGVLTGRGADLIVIDDPMKPQDALSDTKRQAVQQWFDTTLLSRLDDQARGAILLVMQRLHVEDLAGHVLAKDGWAHLDLPAIAEAAADIPIGTRTGPPAACRRGAAPGSRQLRHAGADPPRDGQLRLQCAVPAGSSAAGRRVAPLVVVPHLPRAPRAAGGRSRHAELGHRVQGRGDPRLVRLHHLAQARGGPLSPRRLARPARLPKPQAAGA